MECTSSIEMLFLRVGSPITVNYLQCKHCMGNKRLIVGPVPYRALTGDVWIDHADRMHVMLSRSNLKKLVPDPDFAKRADVFENHESTIQENSTYTFPRSRRRSR